MKQENLLNFFDDTVAKMRATMVAKNSDYCGGNTDPFANFTRVEEINFGVSTEQGLLVRIIDKIMRIGSFVKQGTLMVKDESVTDTLLDLANYAILFAAYLESKKGGWTKYNGIKCCHRWSDAIGRDSDHQPFNAEGKPYCIDCHLSKGGE